MAVFMGAVDGGIRTSTAHGLMTREKNEMMMCYTGLLFRMNAMDDYALMIFKKVFVCY